MGDSLNALLQNQRASTVLQGIANPPQVNPLADIQAGTSVASNIYDLRAKQAQQAWGQILQQSTDPNGNVDYQKAQSLAAQNPVAAMGMQTNLANNANLRGAQINQTSGLYDLIGRASASLMNDPSDANIENIRGSLTSAGAPPGALTELDRIKALTDPNARRAAAYQHINAALDGQGMLARGGLPAPQLQNVGDKIVPTTTVPPTPYVPGGTTVGSGGVTVGPQPGTTTQSVEPYDAQGIIPRDANNVPTRTPTGYGTFTRPITAVPGINPGGQQVTPGQSGSAPSVAPPAPPKGNTVRPAKPPPVAATPSPVPPANPPATPAPVTAPASPVVAPPATNGVPSAPTSGALDTGVRVASANPLQVPATGPPGPPNPLVPGDVADIQSGMANARATPRPPGTQTAYDSRPPIIMTAPPQGQPDEVSAAVQHASDARGRTLTYQRDIQPIEGALTALSGADTGRASETLNSIRANVQDIAPGFIQRMMPDSITDPTVRKNYEEATKYLTQMQLSAPGGARSNVGTETAGAATPSTHISNAAAREVTLAVLAQRRMEHAGTSLFNQRGNPGAQFDTQMGNWTTQADPRAFVVDKMTPQERANYVQSLGGPGTPDKPNPAYQKYKNSYMDAVKSGVSPAPH